MNCTSGVKVNRLTNKPLVCVWIQRRDKLIKLISVILEQLWVNKLRILEIDEFCFTIIIKYLGYNLD